VQVKQVEDEVHALIDGDERFRGRFIHSLGHSLGMDVHDGSYPDADFQSEFSEHMVLTVEPGIYLPGLYGVRIEDDILVGSDGCTLITNAKKEPVAYEIQ
jgi:Xaa-Pro dipeptidase